MMMEPSLEAIHAHRSSAKGSPLVRFSLLGAKSQAVPSRLWWLRAAAASAAYLFEGTDDGIGWGGGTSCDTVLAACPAEGLGGEGYRFDTLVCVNP